MARNEVLGFGGLLLATALLAGCSSGLPFSKSESSDSKQLRAQAYDIANRALQAAITPGAADCHTKKALRMPTTYMNQCNTEVVSIAFNEQSRTAKPGVTEIYGGVIAMKPEGFSRIASGGSLREDDDSLRFIQWGTDRCSSDDSCRKVGYTLLMGIEDGSSWVDASEPEGEAGAIPHAPPRLWDTLVPR